MLTQSALRIGNLVNENGHWKVVTLEMLKTMRTKSTDYFAIGKNSSVTGIRLNEYFARHFPDKNPVVFECRGRVFGVKKHKQNELAWEVFSDEYNFAILTYLHQLQNLVHSLVLEELNLPELNPSINQPAIVKTNSTM